MISPARIEGYLSLEREIAQVMVFGDRRPYLVAVVVPDPEFVAGYLPEDAIPDLAALAADPGFNKTISAAIARVNQRLQPSERVRRFVIAAEPFTIANGQMTPTLKIKRHAIREAYGAALDALYQAKEIAA
jgi:long-chain acyl-CoA synthetase